jgi:hypothetical protein
MVFHVNMCSLCRVLPTLLLFSSIDVLAICFSIVADTPATILLCHLLVLLIAVRGRLFDVRYLLPTCLNQMLSISN